MGNENSTPENGGMPSDYKQSTPSHSTHTSPLKVGLNASLTSPVRDSQETSHPVEKSTSPKVTNSEKDISRDRSHSRVEDPRPSVIEKHLSITNFDDFKMSSSLPLVSSTSSDSPLRRDSTASNSSNARSSTDQLETPLTESSSGTSTPPRAKSVTKLNIKPEESPVDKETHVVLVQQLKEEYVASVIELRKKDEQMRTILRKLNTKNEDVSELTDKIVQIRSNLSVLTVQKNRQISRMQGELEEAEKQIDELQNLQLRKEKRLKETMGQMQRRITFYQSKLLRKEKECAKWKAKAVELDENATVERNASDDEAESYSIKEELINERDKKIDELQKEIERLKGEAQKSKAELADSITVAKRLSYTVEGLSKTSPANTSQASLQVSLNPLMGASIPITKSISSSTETGPRPQAPKSPANNKHKVTNV